MFNRLQVIRAVELECKVGLAKAKLIVDSECQSRNSHSFTDEEVSELIARVKLSQAEFAWNQAKSALMEAQESEVQEAWKDVVDAFTYGELPLRKLLVETCQALVQGYYGTEEA